MTRKIAHHVLVSMKQFRSGILEFNEQSSRPKRRDEKEWVEIEEPCKYLRTDTGDV